MNEMLEKHPEIAPYVITAQSKEIISISELMISIPGTNTIEAAYIGTPMACLLPTNNPEALIFDGALGLSSNIPFIGTVIKKLLIYIVQKRTPYFSKPNRHFNASIVPEWVGHMTPEYVGNQIANLLGDTDALNNQRIAFKELNRTTSLADKIVKTIFTSLQV